MYLFIKLIHVIVAMIFFALPFTFGRWFRTGTQGNTAQVLLTITKIKQFADFHLNMAGLILVLTGFHMGMARKLFSTGSWLWVATLLTFLALANLNFNLRPALRNLEALLRNTPESFDSATTGKRIIIFSALHHTLVTLTIILMVFRPF